MINYDIGFITNNFTFSELLLSLKLGIFSKMLMENFFSKMNYNGSVEDSLYKMSFFEAENKDLLLKRTLYLHLLYLFNNCKDGEVLKYNIDYICDYFKYPVDTRDLIYYIPYQNSDKKWILSERLFEYINKYKELSKLPIYNLTDGLDKLFDNNFTLIGSGKYRNNFISYNKNNKNNCNNKIIINIWSSDIIKDKSSHEFSFDDTDELVYFIKSNNINTYEYISDNFFENEEEYLLGFKTKFNKLVENDI